MKLLVGLGNPGAKYARNRHNVGFRAIDAIWERAGGDAWRNRFHGDCAEIRLGSEKCLLLKPQTFMNESGRAVGAAMQFYKLAHEDVIVFYDEIDLAPGRLRIKTGGGTAGHNGLRSISSQIGNDYVRIRIGVGHPGSKDLVANYVLHDFAKSDGEWLTPLIDTLAASVDRIVAGNYADVMNDVARAVRGAIGGDEDNAADTDSGPKKKPRSAGGKTQATDPAASPAASPAGSPADGGAGKAKGALADKLRDWLGGKND